MMKSNKKSFMNSIMSGYGGILLVLLVFVLLFSLGTDTFFKPNNIILVIRQASIACLMAFGVTFVLIAGSINLGVGSVYGISGICTAMLIINEGLPIWVGIAGAVVIGLLCGLFCGIITVKTNIPAFIATLGVSYILRGATYLISGGVQITVMYDKLNNIGMGAFLGIPLPIYYMIATVIILGLILGNTRTGRYIYATGSNVTAARFAGINTEWIMILVHCIACVLAALSGFVNMARLYNASPGMGEGSEIDAIVAAVIGGTSMAGGSGSLVGTLIGSLIIAVMSNGLNHFGLNSYWQQVATGSLLIIALGLDELKKHMELKQIMKKAAGESGS